ncbi:Alpha/Beta hydrolase protein [Hypomontagnella monticulosa]|nr:Alpha/Beta hydrolase protein [Hypomontagnella monticulosa]
MALVIDPNYAELFKEEDGSPFGTYDSTDLAVFRTAIDANMIAMSQALPEPEGIQESTYSTTSLDGTPLEIFRFVPQSVHDDSKPPSSRLDRALIFAFGGGMVAGSVQGMHRFITTLAHRSQTQVFAPQYRLAPEHPAPAGIEDVYTTIQWVQAGAARFDIDPARIVLFGISAGGGIVASAALMARDKGLTHPIAGQCLRYPMLDDRTTMEEGDPRERYLTWTPAMNEMGWRCYLGGKRGGEAGAGKGIPAYAVPARAENLRGLPPAHIGVGSLDLFRDEDAAYAAALARADVGVEFHLYPGVPHCFEVLPSIKMGGELWDNEVRWIMKF